MKRLLVGFAVLGTLGATATFATAEIVTVTFGGDIEGVGDSTGLNIMSGAGILPNSTFTGSFAYDSDSASYASNAFGAAFNASSLVSPLTVTINGNLVFSGTTLQGISLSNDRGAPFYDNFNINSLPNAFPVIYNPLDNFFRFTLTDPSQTVFGPNPSLPTSLSLADFSQGEIFIRSDFDRSLGQLWDIDGVVTSLTSVSASVPEPATVVMLATGRVPLLIGCYLGRKKSCGSAH